MKHAWTDKLEGDQNYLDTYFCVSAEKTDYNYQDVKQEEKIIDT